MLHHGRNYGWPTYMSAFLKQEGSESLAPALNRGCVPKKFSAAASVFLFSVVLVSKTVRTWSDFGTVIWGFPKKLGGTFVGVPIIRTIVYWGLCWGPLILGNYHFSTGLTDESQVLSTSPKPVEPKEVARETARNQKDIGVTAVYKPDYFSTLQCLHVYCFLYCKWVTARMHFCPNAQRKVLCFKLSGARDLVPEIIRKGHQSGVADCITWKQCRHHHFRLHCHCRCHRQRHRYRATETPTPPPPPPLPRRHHHHRNCSSM